MRVGTQGLFRLYLKPFLPTRLTAPGSPRMGEGQISVRFVSAECYGKCGHETVPDLVLRAAPCNYQLDKEIVKKKCPGLKLGQNKALCALVTKSLV